MVYNYQKFPIPFTSNMMLKMLIPVVAVFILSTVSITGDEIPTDRQAKDFSNDAIIFRGDKELSTNLAYKQLHESLPQIIKLAKENGRQLQECNKKLEKYEQVTDLYEKCQQELVDRNSNDSNSDKGTCDKIINSLQDELETVKNKTKDGEDLGTQNKDLQKRVKALELEVTMYKEATSMFNATEIEIHNALTTCLDDAQTCSQELRNAQQVAVNLGMDNAALQFSKDDCKRYNDACQNDLSKALEFKKACFRDLTICNMSVNYCVSRIDLCTKMAILFEANQEGPWINKGRTSNTDTENDEEEEINNE